MASFWTAVSRGQALLDLVRSRTEVARAPEDPRTRGWYVVAIPDGDLNALPLRMSWALWCLVTIVLFHRVWPDAKLTGLRMALSANHRWHISRRQRLQSFALLRTSSLHSSRRAPFQSSPPYLSPPCHQVQTSVRRLGSAGSWLKLRGWITGHRGLLQMQQVVSGHQPGNKRVVALADGSMLFVEQLSSLADPWAPYSPMGRAIHCQQWRDAPHYAQHLEDQQQASSFKQRCSRARVLMQGIGTGDRV